MSFARGAYAILIDLFETIVIAGGIFVVIYAFLFRPFQVNGQSMYPNFHDGEYVLTNLISLRLKPLQRGEVIVFKAPPNNEKDFIKRVIGLPGDTVELKSGSTYINGKKLDESAYLAPSVKTYGGAFLPDNNPVTVPPDQYFVMGDNREFSSDSREWGFVPQNKLIGRSFLIYWPLNMFHIVPNVTGSYNISSK